MVRTGPSRPFDISATPSASRPGTPRTITEGTAVIPAKVRSKPPTSSFSLSPSTARAPVSPVSKTIICQPAGVVPRRPAARSLLPVLVDDQGGAEVAGEAARVEATDGVLDVDLHVVGVVQIEDGPRLAPGGEDQLLPGAGERCEAAGEEEDERQVADEGRELRPGVAVGEEVGRPALGAGRDAVAAPPQRRYQALDVRGGQRHGLALEVVVRHARLGAEDVAPDGPKPVRGADADARDEQRQPADEPDGAEDLEQAGALHRLRQENEAAGLA